MKTIDAAEFQDRCLALLDETARDGERLLIVKQGRPVARLLPVQEEGEAVPQRVLRGSVRILSDLTDPTTLPHDWRADDGHS
jgi:prevent-host-death family protein